MSLLLGLYWKAFVVPADGVQPLDSDQLNDVVVLAKRLLAYQPDGFWIPWVKNTDSDKSRQFFKRFIELHHLFFQHPIMQLLLTDPGTTIDEVTFFDFWRAFFGDLEAAIDVKVNV